MDQVNVLIIGGGPGGIATAIWCKRLNLTHMIVERSDKLGGQLAQIYNKIIDYPGILEGTGKQIMERFISHIHELGCNYICGYELTAIDMDKKIASVSSSAHTKLIMFDYIVVSTGASPKMLGVSGEKEMLQRGETYSASKDSNLFQNKRVVVVGGGDRALEGALILANSGAHVILVHRSAQFRARKEYLTPVKSHPNVTILVETIITEILGNNKVTGVEVKSRDTEPYIINADAVFIRIGVKPNSEIFSDLVQTTKDGYIITDSRGKTSHNSIYAVGDVCTEPIYSSISLAVGQGMKVAKHLSTLYKN